MTCDLQQLLTDSKCLTCLSPIQLEIVKTQLLCVISKTGGGGGGGTIQVYTGAAPPAAPDDPTKAAIFYPDSGGPPVKEWDIAGAAWVNLPDLPDVDYFNLVGSAYLGGDQTGDPRGAGALDVQSFRSAATEVASGVNSSGVGVRNTASGNLTTSFGYRNSASGYISTAFGYRNTSSGYLSMAFGGNCICSGQQSSSFGYRNNVSGIHSGAFGYYNISSGAESFTFGLRSTASGDYTTAMGWQSVASANASSSFGYQCNSSASSASSFGFLAASRIPFCTNICGPQLIRKDDLELAANAFRNYCGVETVFMTKEVNCLSAATQTLTLPAGCHFFVDEVFAVCTSVTGLIDQPFFKFGITGNNSKFVGSTQSSLLTSAQTRERWMVSSDGETSLTATVDTIANSATMTVRFGFRGLLIEDQ